MKQGTLINRIVMLLLLAAVLVYLGVSAWRSFRDPYTLVLLLLSLFSALQYNK